MINSLPLTIVEVDLESRMIGWNPAAQRILGCIREEMLGRTDTPMVSDWKRDEHKRLAEAQEIAHVGSWEGDIVSNRAPVRMLGTAQDITDGRLELTSPIGGGSRVRAEIPR